MVKYYIYILEEVMNKKELGKFGEEAAAEYLKLQGYEML